MDRTELPGGSVYNMVDFIPDQIQAITGGRGGWTYAGPSLSTAPVTELGYQPDLAQVVGVDSLGQLWNVISGSKISSSTFMAQAPNSPSAYHRGYLIFATPKGSIYPAYYKSDASMGLLTNAPQADLVSVYKDHAVLANDHLANTNRVWFSAAGDPTSWDMSFGWWDTTGAVTALIPLTNSLLIGHANTVERLRGTTPPPGTDMVLEPFLSFGVLDPNSVAFWNSSAVFASSDGIYLTDGVSSVDLTAAAEMKAYWYSLLTGYTSSWVVSGGIYRDHYIVSVVNASGVLVDSLCVSLLDRTMWRFTNLPAASFKAVGQLKQEKLYMSFSLTPRVAELSSMWAPSATVKHDGDGTNPTPILETGMFRGYDRLHRRWIESMGKQKWRYVYVDYDLRDSASDNPTMTLSYCSTPTGAYTATDRTLPETTDVSRIRRSLSPTQGGATHSQMLGLKLAVTGPYKSASLYAIEGSFEPIEIGAL